jgi:hypothetical protein
MPKGKFQSSQREVSKRPKGRFQKGRKGGVNDRPPVPRHHCEAWDFSKRSIGREKRKKRFQDLLKFWRPYLKQSTGLLRVCSVSGICWSTRKLNFLFPFRKFFCFISCGVRGCRVKTGGPKLSRNNRRTLRSQCSPVVRVKTQEVQSYQLQVPEQCVDTPL